MALYHLEAQFGDSYSDHGPMDDEARAVLASCAANLEEKLGSAFVAMTVSKKIEGYGLSFRGQAGAKYAVVSVNVVVQPPHIGPPVVQAIMAAVLKPGAAPGDNEMEVRMMTGADCQPWSSCKF